MLIVFGAPAMAESGQLICVLAGPSAAVDQVKPYTKGVISRANIDFSGQPHGQATLMKIIGNTCILNMIESLSEGHTVAEKSGLGNDNMHAFVEAMFPGPYVAYSNRLMAGDYYKREEVSLILLILALQDPRLLIRCFKPLFGVDLARKDARHALDLAKSSGTRMRGLEVVDGHLADVQKHMSSKGDVAGMYGAVRQESGLSFEN